jgi:hypothetical protein
VIHILELARYVADPIGTNIAGYFGHDPEGGRRTEQSGDYEAAISEPTSATALRELDN